MTQFSRALYPLWQKNVN